MNVVSNDIFFVHSQRYRPLKRYTSATFIQAKYTRVQLDITINVNEIQTKRK